jgi:hypothetical protein
MYVCSDERCGECVKHHKLIICTKNVKDLIMVYNIPNYWGSGLCSSSEILKTRKHNVSETGSAPVLRLEEEDTYSVL